MDTTGPAFYMYELDNWNDAIDLRMAEIDKTINWLKKILDSKTKPELNTGIEDYLHKFYMYRNRKELLVKDIEKLESYLFKNKISMGEENITIKTKDRQTEMRSIVYNAEKDYLDLMYKCTNFLAENIN